MKRLRLGLLVLVVLAALVGGACGGGGDESADGGGDSSAGMAEEGPPGDADYLDAPAGVQNAGGNGGGTAARPGMKLPTTGPSVIKTADIRVEIDRDGFQDAFQAVVGVAQERGGFVLSSQVGGDDARKGSLTIRVPAETFEAALGEIGGLGKVERRSVSGQDVTAEFVDLQARLRNYTAQEAVLLRLMDRAESIQDTIRVQNELTGIQLEIERLRGRLRYLEDQTDLSTITVFLTEQGVAAAEDMGVLERAWQTARDTTGAIVTGVLVGGAAVLPVSIVLLIAFLLFRWVRPRLPRTTEP